MQAFEIIKDYYWTTHSVYGTVLVSLKDVGYEYIVFMVTLVVN